MTEMLNGLPYQVGGLLYTPAVNTGIAEKILDHAYPCLTSMAFCLEDSIRDEALAEAEETLKQTLSSLREKQIPRDQLPLLFVRVRTPRHLAHVHRLLGEESDILTGYILPKFDLTNCGQYVQIIQQINMGRSRSLYVMPILESKMIADLEKRTATLMSLKGMLDSIQEYVLNVRVGGNDFSNLYGLRRGVHQNIYQVGVIRDILVDIVNVFAVDYVVSGPVWEYFGTDENAPWAEGLRKELELDLLNGFIGKTCIHPCQLPIIFDSLKVRRADYEDAIHILGWRQRALGVEKSADGSRMNEVKCHQKWALRIATMGKVYGIKED